MQRWGSVFFLLILASFMSFNLSWAEEESAAPKILQGIEFLTGFSHTVIHIKGDAKGNYNTAPLFVSFDFNLKPLTEKIGFSPASLVQFQLEPEIAAVYEPFANVEVGNAFLLKLGILPEDYKFQPYIKGGAGLLYTTQHAREQGTQFSFCEYAGAGAHYFITKATALTLEGRFRHASNADIKKPNRGINCYFILCGVAYQF